MLTTDQLADWERDGYLELPGFVDPDRCAELKAHVEDLLDAVDPDLDGAMSVFSTTDQSHAQDDWFLTSGDQIRWFFDGAWSDKPPETGELEWLNATDNFAAAVRGEAEPLCPGRDGRRTQSILDAMYRSAYEAGGDWVEVKPELD